MDDLTSDDLSAVFNQALAEPPSPTETAIWREAMGEEYPDGADPYSWVSRSELATIGDVVRDTGPRLVDIGCGRGGPGLWVAAASGAQLVGVDIAQVALDAAAESATRLGIAAEFRVGRFEELPLQDDSADVVMSVDAFLFTPDKPAAAKELARVLRPGGRLVMTTWDFASQPANRPPQVDDHRPLLGDAGFTIEEYAETEDWSGRQGRSLEAMRARVTDLAAESGEEVEETRAGIEDRAASMACMLRRILVVARRP